MNSQAEQMKGMVSSLVVLVRGSEDGGRAQRAAAPKPKELTPKIVTEERKRAARPIFPVKAKIVTPEELIPLEEGEFKDF
jgi:hypothetical protein